MNNIENFDIRLELFLKNHMTEEEGKVFLNELQNNPDRKERAQAMAAMIKNMKELNFEYGQRVVSKIEHLSEQEFRKEAGLPHKAKILPLRQIVRWSFAACFVGAIAMGTNRYYLYIETIALGNSYYAQIPTELVVRDADDTAMQLTELFANVKDNKELSNTILCLEDKFTLAISETYNDYTIYINDIGWNLAIAYLKDGDRKDALKTLELLIAYSESNIVIEKGKKLIEEIKQL